MPVGFNPKDGGKVSSPNVSRLVLLLLCLLELRLLLDADEHIPPAMFEVQLL